MALTVKCVLTLMLLRMTARRTMQIHEKVLVKHRQPFYLMARKDSVLRQKLHQFAGGRGSGEGCVGDNQRQLRCACSCHAPNENGRYKSSAHIHT